MIVFVIFNEQIVREYEFFICILQVGGVTPAQISVYEEFAHNIPGFLPTNETPQAHPGVTKPVPVSEHQLRIENLMHLKFNVILN